MFQAPKLTNAGKALYYDNMAGTQLKFTTIKLGSGTLSGSIANLTNLVNTVVTISATATKYEDYANVAGSFSNAQLAEGFYWREIGVFAANPSDPDNRAADILYCYQNAYDTADFIPVASVETVEKNITVPVIVGDATAVSCTLSKSLVFVTQQDLEAQKGGANGVASLDANGKITQSQVDYLLKSIVAAADYDPTATYAAGAYRTHDGQLYKCTTAITVAEAWTTGHWAATSVGAEIAALYTALAGKATADHTHTAVSVGAVPGRPASIDVSTNLHTLDFGTYFAQGNISKSNNWPYDGSFMGYIFVYSTKLRSTDNDSHIVIDVVHEGNGYSYRQAKAYGTWGSWGKIATTFSLTATVSATWTSSGGYYYQDIATLGTLVGDNPIVDVLTGNDNAANDLYIEALSKIKRIAVFDGWSEIWCKEPPAISFPIQIKVVR